MATHSNKKFVGSNVTAEQQGLDDTETKPYEPVLSPEQRRILAQVYQLILGWRRERLMKTGHVITMAETNGASVSSGTAIAVEVEA